VCTTSQTTCNLVVVVVVVVFSEALKHVRHIPRQVFAVHRGAMWPMRNNMSPLQSGDARSKIKLSTGNPAGLTSYLIGCATWRSGMAITNVYRARYQPDGHWLALCNQWLGNGLDDPGFESRRGQEDFTLLQNVHTGSGTLLTPHSVGKVPFRE
jgi:hypothetical protein